MSVFSRRSWNILKELLSKLPALGLWVDGCKQKTLLYPMYVVLDNVSTLMVKGKLTHSCVGVTSAVNAADLS